MNLKKPTSILAAVAISMVCQLGWASEPDLTQARPGDAHNLDAALRQKSGISTDQSPVENQAGVQIGQTASQGSDVKFDLVKMNIDQSAILSKEQIAGITSQYEGHEVTLQDIYDAIEKINQLYRSKPGYIAQALLPPQKIQEGMVTIRLAESRIGKYRIEGNKYIKGEYLTQRMALKSGDLVRLDKLEQDVIRFNKTNGSQLKVVLVKGESFGATDVVLKAIEQPRQQAVLYSDNAGSESTGQYRLGAVWSMNGLQAGGDSLTVNTTYAKGTTGGGISYQTPIDYMGTQLGINYNKNQTNIIAGIFQSLQVEGESTDSSISINHPFTTTLDTKQNIYLELHKKTSDTNFSGANLTALTIKSAVMGVAEQKYYRNGMFYKRFDFTTGYAYNEGQAFDANRQSFAKLNFSYVNRIMQKNNRAVLLRVSGQYNANPEKTLPSTELFTLGGFSTVRGYKEGALTGDKGYFISGEYHFPIGKTEGVVFIDHGGAFSYDGQTTPNNRDCYMTSVGIGMIANIAKDTSLQVFLGTPINIPVAKGKYADGSHLHFYMQHML